MASSLCQEQGHCEDYSRQLSDKVAWIHLGLDFSFSFTWGYSSNISEVSASPKCRITQSFKFFPCQTAAVHVTVVPFVFWVQIKVPIITFKGLHGTGAGYLWDYLSLMTSGHFTRSGKMDMP